MADKKILIGMPCMDTIPVKVVEHLMNLIKPCECYYKFVSGSLVYDARDAICQLAIQGKYTHVLFIDSDMFFEPEALKKALDRDVDILTGLYFKRRDKHEPVLYKSIGQREYREDGTVKQHGFAHIETDLSRDFFQVEGCGFGFVLIKVEVLKKIKKEFISWFEPIQGLGEDLSFCQKLKALNIPLWCDTTIKLGHYGNYCYTWKDWEIDAEEEDGIKIEWNKSAK